MLKRHLFTRMVALISVLSVGACSASMETTTTAITPATATLQVQNNAGTVVETTVLSTTGVVTQPDDVVQGEAAAGAASVTSPVDSQSSPQALQPGAMTPYIDPTYHFSVNYPATFVMKAVPADKLTQLIPQPTAAFTWMDPEIAASATVELEPADLEIRIYPADAATTLESWLTNRGLWTAESGVPLQPFQAAGVAGVRLCASTMIVPNCFDFILGDGWVYQLLAVTAEGESMGKTFALLP